MQPLPNNAQVHVDGLGLNDKITILSDPRDPQGGNASHHFQAVMHTSEGDVTLADVQYQHGPRDEKGSTDGVTDEVLVAIQLERYRGFQSGPFACRENEMVVMKLEEALHWMRERAWARHRQGVLGKNEQHKQPE